MELLVVNLVSAPRRATLAGRSYLVSPVTLIVPGILHGSQGPLYYPPDEVQRNVQAWNGMPLVLQHPKTSAGYVSARTPEVLDTQQLGVLLNVRYADKLTGEAWFDEERLRQADSSLYARVAAGQPVEMSTGLWTDNENTPGTHNGVGYSAVARNYRPDHLAVLPDSKGACSVSDGCGINVNKKEENAMDEKQKKALVDFIIANCSKCEEKDRTALNELPDAYLTAWHDDLKGAKDKLEAVANEAHKPFKAGEQEFTWDAEKKAWQTKAPEKKVEPVVANQDAKPALTKEQEDDLSFARQVRQERRDEAITAIKANEANKLTDEQLKAMPLDVLQGVANSFPKKEQPHDPTYVGGSGKPTANARERYPYVPLPGETAAPAEKSKA